MNTTVKIGLKLIATVLAIPLFLSGAYFLHGSFEQFPSNEQQEGVRIVSGLSFILFALLEAIVLIKLLGKGRFKSGVLVAQKPAKRLTPPPSSKTRD